MWGGLVFCLWMCLGAQGGGREERLVQTAQGPIRGYKEPGDSFFSFYGIPYATIPTGKFKFQAPLPAPTWQTILESENNNIMCPQTTISTFEVSGTTKENCLIANVFVPDTDQKNLPVVVFVHGGGYLIGHSTMFHMKNVVRSKKVILVTFNYRLGIHGFLCLGTELAPGNAGMKDQVALLKWVQQHISSFGGNPDAVTLEGSSAGSSAVDILMISPATCGLFNRVIPESGASIATWSVQVDPIGKAKDFAKANGIENVDDVYELEKFYTTASYDVLNADNYWNRTDFTFGFTPCVERSTQGAFLTESPYRILKNGNYRKVPMLYGFAGMEGLLRLNKFDEWKDKMNENFSAFLPADLEFKNDDERNEVVKKIKQFYFDGKPVSEENILGFVDIMSDLLFAYSTMRAVNLHVKSGHDKIFLYEYNFVDDQTPVVPHTKNVKGASHCDQSLAIYDGTPTDYFLIDESGLTDEMKNMKRVLREIWLNFMTSGTPVPPSSSLPAWPPTGAGGSPHMAIDSTLELRGALLEQRVRFWDEIYEKYYREPQAPPTPPDRRSEL